ncbi:hypothetical protein OB919_08020 [Halobacteria archaeon AArc-curdl1]|uniref:Uncharacterized protein n=1 Tax=Natronosalvus hydrolyticus TaxID=2979988 RepID=A0AAP2Z7Z7_9EURY|nr:hypothetical protein [Halobacteria archaeon AArc-curdl1]
MPQIFDFYCTNPDCGFKMPSVWGYYMYAIADEVLPVRNALKPSFLLEGIRHVLGRLPRNIKCVYDVTNGDDLPFLAIEP